MVLTIDAIIALFEFGLLDVILPFLLAFIITFALLEKSHVLGKKSRRTNAVIAFVAGLVFINLFTFKTFMATVLWFVFLFIAVISFVLLIRTLGIESKPTKLVVSIVFILFVIAISHNFVDLSKFVKFFFNPIVLTIIVFGIIVWYIIGAKDSGEMGSGDANKDGKKDSKSDDKKADKKQDKDEKMNDQFAKNPLLMKSIPAEELYKDDKPGTIWEMEEKFDDK